LTFDLTLKLVSESCHTCLCQF